MIKLQIENKTSLEINTMRGDGEKRGFPAAVPDDLCSGDGKHSSVGSWADYRTRAACTDLQDQNTAIDPRTVHFHFFSPVEISWQTKTAPKSVFDIFSRPFSRLFCVIVVRQVLYFSEKDVEGLQKTSAGPQHRLLFCGPCSNSCGDHQKEIGWPLAHKLEESGQRPEACD